MKNLSNKILVIVFIGFLALSLLLTSVVKFGDIVSSLYENKEQLFNYSTAFSTLSSAFSGNLMFIEKYADIYGGIHKAQGNNAVWTESFKKTYVVGSDGKLYLCTLFDKSKTEVNEQGITESNKKTLTECAEALSDFAEKITKKDIDFFFVQAPDRYDPECVDLPVSMMSTGMASINYLSDLLKDDENINLLNLQEYFHEQNIPFDDWFFATDHHWTIKMAFSAYQKICEMINVETDIEIDEFYYNNENWNCDIIEKVFLGSLGKNTGNGFIEKDDLELIYPNFETDYVVVSTSRGNPYVTIEKGDSVTLEGTYTDAVFNTHETPFSYSSYLGGDLCEIRVTNSKVATDKKILVIKDSFALPVSAFLSTCFAETRLLDPRYFHEDIYEYINSYEPDMVLVLYNPGAYSIDPFFSF